MAVDENCATKQTFCALSKQTVSDNSSLKFSYDGCITKNEIIEDETWNELITAIIKVYNFGLRGTRNPKKPFSVNPDTDVSDTTSNEQKETKPSKRISTEAYANKLETEYNSITLDHYNTILSTIGAKTLPNTDRPDSSPFIYGTYFQETMDALNNYKLDDTRCNNCNVACNQKCQAKAQCCDSHCCTQCCTECCTDCCTNACQYTCEAGYDACTHCETNPYSAQKYKENIHIFNNNALKLINDIKVVSFNYKDDPNKNYKVGFIADYTNEIFSTFKHDQMDMYNCIGVLFKAIQELSKDNQLLKSKIEEIKKRTDT